MRFNRIHSLVSTQHSHSEAKRLVTVGTVATHLVHCALGYRGCRGCRWRLRARVHWQRRSTLLCTLSR